MKKRKGMIIAIDVDGTLTRGTAWNSKDARIAGKKARLIKRINELYDSNFIVIYTARSDDMYQATKDWLEKNGVKYHAFSSLKIPVDIYVDSKAVRPEEL